MPLLLLLLLGGFTAFAAAVRSNSDSDRRIRFCLFPREKCRTSRLLHAGIHYKIIVCGTYRLSRCEPWLFFFTRQRWYSADAVSHTSVSHAYGTLPPDERFDLLYEGLYFDEKPAPFSFIQDAEEHEFWFYYLGQDRALTIALRPPAWAVEVDGKLEITVEPLSETEQELIPEVVAAKRAEAARKARWEMEEQRRAEEQRREAERFRAEEKRRRAEEQRKKEEEAKKEREATAEEEARKVREEEEERQNKERAVAEAQQKADKEAAHREREEEERRRQKIEHEMQTCIWQLVTRYREFPLYEDQDFLQKYAKANLQLLLHRRQQIVESYCDFHKDKTFIERLRNESEETYQRFTFEMRALAEAERLAVEPVSLPVLSPPPRKTLTNEEREAKVAQYRTRMLERARIQAEDYMAKVKQNVDLLAEFRADLEQSNIEPEQIQMMEQDFCERLFIEEEPNNGSGKQI